MFLVKRTVSRWLAIVLFLSLLMPAILSVPVHTSADVPKENLALNKAVYPRVPSAQPAGKLYQPWMVQQPPIGSL